MRASFLRCIIAACCFSSIANIAIADNLIYWININKVNPTIASISVDTANLGKFILEPPRSINIAGKKAGLDVTCKQPSKHDISIEFGKPISCQSIQ